MRPESEVVRDNGIPVAYRQVRDDQGGWLKEPLLLLPDGQGRWAQADSPVDAATYEAWLASANQAHDAARTLYDIAARSGSDLPESERLTTMSDDAVRDLLHRSDDDAAAAVYEWVRRTGKVALRWTQLSASHALADSQVVNMAAGEGKSWLFFVDAVRQAVRPGVGAVHVITTRGNLADREFERYSGLLERLRIDVYRMNSDNPPPPPAKGQPTIYIGTSQDVGFTKLKTDLVPGQEDGVRIRIDAGIDEIDELAVYSDPQYLLSEGVKDDAELPLEIRDPVQQATLVIREGLADGRLTTADFGRAEGQVGGRAALTEEGEAKVAEILGAPLTEDHVKRLNMAAAAHFEYVENVHYVVHEGSVYIIDQTTHEVLYNPETATESRWNGGLAQAVEDKHGIRIRHDPATSKMVTARELYQKDGPYKRVTGASGTANGKGKQFEAIGLPGTIASIPRYYASRLGREDDHVSPDLDAKLDAIAADIADMKAGSGNPQPQLILAHRNDLVADLSQKLTGLGVDHTAIDAKWFLEQGTNREAAFKAAVEEAGKPGAVLVINMQGARGVDIPLTEDAKAAGGLHVRVTARSGLSRDIDIQAENRAARSGDAGSVSYYISPDDDAFALSRNDDVQLAIVQYRGALAVGEGVNEAEQVLRDKISDAQDEADARVGMHTNSGYQANAPPTATAGTKTGDAPSSIDQPPPQQLPPSQQTRSGFYFTDGASTSADVLANELTAAQSFPRLSGATALHVHFSDGAFSTGGRTLTPSQFHDEVLSELDLPEGQPLILVACQTAAATQVSESVGALLELATASGRPVVGATTDVFTTTEPRVIAAAASFDADGRPVFTDSQPGDWAIAWPHGEIAAGLGADLLTIVQDGTLAAHLPGVALARSEPAEPPVSPVRWTNQRPAGRTGRIPALGVPAIPPGASPVPERIRGYLTWPGSLENFRQQAQDGTLIGPGNTHLQLWTAEPAAVPRNAYLIELTISGGAALRLPGGGDSRLWLPGDRLNHATVLRVDRDTSIGFEQDEAFGVQGRRLGDLADGRPAVQRIPGDAERVLRVLPAEPEVMTSRRIALRAEYVRTVNSLGGVGLGPAEPIRWLAKDAEGLPLHDAHGQPYQRDIGLTFLHPEERQEFPWGMVIFDNRYVLARQKSDGSRTWGTRELPFQVTERTFFVHVHSNPYAMVGPAIEGPLARALSLWPGYRVVSGARLARAVLESELYQRAVQTHGDDLEIVLFACWAVPHVREFAAALGRPAWTTNGAAIAGPTPFGNRIGITMQEGEPEPGWYAATPSGTMLQVTPVPHGGKVTQSGFYIPDGVSTSASVLANELTAAQSFPRLSGATALHVHFRDNAFIVAGRLLTPSRFHGEVLSQLDLPAGQPLILVACQAAVTAQAPGSVAAVMALARLSGRPVIGATADVFTTPAQEVVSAHASFDEEGRPLLGASQPGDWVAVWPDGQFVAGLGPDLLASLAAGTLAAHNLDIKISAAETAVSPAWAVRWATPGIHSGDQLPANRTPGRTTMVPLRRRIAELTAGPRSPGPRVTRLSAPHDSLSHELAAQAAPYADGFITLVAHGRNGKVVDGDAELTGAQLAVRLGLHVTSATSEDAPPDERTGVIMLTCDSPEAAAELHAATGFAHPVLYPDGRSIITPAGDVMAGTFTEGKNRKPVAQPSGEWLALIDGEVFALGTPLLSEAADGLGIRLRSPALPPTEPVAFYADLTPAQTGVLEDAALKIGDAAPDRAGRFFSSLIAVAADRLRAVLGLSQADELTPELLRDQMTERYRRRPGRYRDYLPSSVTPDQMLADLHGLQELDWQAAELLPHLAADTFRLDLAVLGAQGQPMLVGEAGLPRTANQDGQPFLLVRTTGGQFAPTEPEPGAQPRPGMSLRAPARRVPAAGQPTAWLEDFDESEQALIDQEAQATPLPVRLARPDLVGRIAEIQYLAKVGPRTGRHRGRRSKTFCGRTSESCSPNPPGKRRTSRPTWPRLTASTT